MCAAACIASTPESGMAAWAILPWTGHLHLQAAVVRGDDLVAEAGGNHQVG